MSRKSKENHTAAEGCFRFGAFDLYPGERQLLRDQRVVVLPPKVFDALLLFVRNAERLVRREQLIDTLWPDTFVTDANLTNIIVALRKLLGHDAIQTVSKFGYRFCIPVVGEPGIHEKTYARFLEGKALVGVRSPDSMARARDVFALCVAEDPDFAAAWAWLGRCTRFLHKFTDGSPLMLDLAQAALRRALAIDPHLASAQHFYAQLQIDLGEAQAAARQLVERLVARGDDPETYAALVQALRYCGLLEESVAAHERATALDPTVVTSVTHTHFLRGDYRGTVETYTGMRYYLDAAAWAALGETARAIALLRERAVSMPQESILGHLGRSLLAILEGRRQDAIAIMEPLEIKWEPEAQFYLARHWALIGAASEAIDLIGRARRGGLTSSATLRHDAAFASLRHEAPFVKELETAEESERGIKRELERATAGRLDVLFGERRGRD